MDLTANAASAATLALADLNAHCFLTVGIATAVVSVTRLPAEVIVEEIMDSAELVAAVRHDQFAAALQKPDPADRLAREFAAVVPYLP